MEQTQRLVKLYATSRSSFDEVKRVGNLPRTRNRDCVIAAAFYRVMVQNNYAIDRYDVWNFFPVQFAKQKKAPSKPRKLREVSTYNKWRHRLETVCRLKPICRKKELQCTALRLADQLKFAADELDIVRKLCNWVGAAHLSTAPSATVPQPLTLRAFLERIDKLPRCVSTQRFEGIHVRTLAGQCRLCGLRLSIGSMRDLVTRT